MRLLVTCSGVLVAAGLILVLVVAIVGATSQVMAQQSGGCVMSSCGTPSPQGDNAVTLRARAMAVHLNSSCIGSTIDCVGDAAFDSGFPQEVIRYGQQTCPGCLAWQNAHFQCVVFVLASYGTSFPAPANWTHALDYAGNANTWWGTYGTPDAQKLGYREISARGGLPLSPGDIMVWSGGADGHVSIVLGWTPTSITFAQANGEKPIQTLPLSSDGTVNTHGGYWDSFTVQGYIHPIWLQAATPAPGASGALPGGGTNSDLVTLAEQDATAHHIPAAYFVRQINQESGFNPTALGPKVLDNGTWTHAEGIAQFLPSVAAGLGIDPWDPVAALSAAAGQMEAYQQTYGGDDYKALAAYNWGPGNLARDLRTWGADWFAHIPAETRHYIQTITGVSAPTA